MAFSGVSRRGLLQSAAGLAAATGVDRAFARGTRDRPNILWLVSEDNAPWLGAYGDKVARTPNLDALAKKGIVYENAFSTAPVCAPSRFAILTGVHAASNAPAQHMRAAAPFPPALSTYPDLLRRAGYHCTNNAKTDYNCTIDPKAIWDDSSDKAHWRSRPAGKPFMAVFNSMTTHERFLFKPTTGAASPADVRLPAYLPDTPAIRQDFASYHNLIEKMDGEIGARLAELEADGLADDTIVFYYSDHGGILPRTKHYAYNEGFHAPLIVYLPPRWAHLAPVAAGSRVKAPVSFVDLAPTLLSLAGATAPATMQGKAFLGRDAGTPNRIVFGGRDRMDERYDMLRTAMDGQFHYIRNYMPHRINGINLAYSWQMKSFQDWERLWREGKLNAVQSAFFQPKPYEELYDLRSDPDQTVNLASDPDHRAKLAYYARALDRHMLATRDNGFIPEGSGLEGYGRTRTDRDYPLRAAMTLAAMAAKRDPSHLPAFVRRLSHRSEVLRFWAAQVLLMLGKHAQSASGSLETTMARDSSLSTRIVAAEALAGLGKADGAVAFLASVLDGTSNTPVRLQAVNALTFVGSAATPARPSVVRGTQDNDIGIRSASRYLLAQLDGTYRPDFPVLDREHFLRTVSSI
ncbi:sulfatase [Sphingomonas sp. G-3-2-10]|uniref:sulfatase family protein n=1 Tax=Sphingomonas sp. G-3-2-10 TaxID=2728838 RepID=UPI00146A8FFC|nr:sulfatase [Sphingomonas sp. G-3-2-10]NML08077.1 sulfatase [Sphingomonas sp. G-3-2-10]